MSHEEQQTCTEYGCERAATHGLRCTPHQMEYLERVLSLSRQAIRLFQQEIKDLKAQKSPATDRTVERGQIWKHVKTGNSYRVLYLAIDEATGTDLVVYQSTNRKAHPTVWVRQLEVFLSEGSAGVPRFDRKV
jgi:hypothetical protein